MQPNPSVFCTGVQMMCFLVSLCKCSYPGWTMSPGLKSSSFTTPTTPLFTCSVVVSFPPLPSPSPPPPPPPTTPTLWTQEQSNEPLHTLLPTPTAQLLSRHGKWNGSVVSQIGTSSDISPLNSVFESLCNGTTTPSSYRPRLRCVHY